MMAMFAAMSAFPAPAAPPPPPAGGEPPPPPRTRHRRLPTGSRAQLRRHSPHRARSVACPRCKAKPGQPCDSRTLGRHPFHAARLQAAEDTP